MSILSLKVTSIDKCLKHVHNVPMFIKNSCDQPYGWLTKLSNVYLSYLCEISITTSWLFVTTQLAEYCSDYLWNYIFFTYQDLCRYMIHSDILADFKCISSFGESSRSINVYANHTSYSKSKNTVQIRDVFITGGCHHILEIWDVTEVHHLIVWCWCIFWRRMWQVQAVWEGKGTLLMWLWLPVNT